MSPNCSILASIFQNYPWGGMPPVPPSSSMLCMLGSVLCTRLKSIMLQNLYIILYGTSFLFTYYAQNYS